jgi:hypothetical protein
MIARKVNCMQCRNYAQCSLRTRLFVNYCGPTTRDIDTMIKAAIEDCSLRHGRMIFPPVTRLSYALQKQHQHAAL